MSSAVATILYSDRTSSSFFLFFFMFSPNVQCNIRRFALHKTCTKHQNKNIFCSASAVNDDYYRFSNINFEFCTDGWQIPASYSEQNDITTSLWNDGSADINITEEIKYYTNKTTIIHGLFQSTDTISKIFNPVSPFDQITISFSFWSIDIGGTGNIIHFKVDNFYQKMFMFNAASCPNMIEYDKIDNASVYMDLNNKTLICVAGK